MINCSKCGTANEKNSRFCFSCGERIESGTRRRIPPPPRRKPDEHPPSEKNPTLATILSLLIVGLGQFYNGDSQKGVFMLIGGIVLGTLSAGLIWFIFAIYSAYDAYQVASGKKSLGQW